MTSLKQLLDHYCPGGVEYVRLGDVATVGTGRCDRKNATADGEFPFFVRSQQILRYPTYQFDEEAIIVPGEGGVGDIFHYINGKYALHQRAYRVHFTKDYVNTKFALYVFKTTFKSYVISRAVTATVSSLRKPMFTEFPIPLPPREVQDKIVEILDTFAALCENLDTEIAQREQQFTVYREKLMSSLRSDSTLGDHGEFLRGKGIQKKDFLEKGRPAFHYGQVHTKYEYQTIETAAHISDELFERSTLALPGDLVIATTSEDDEAVAKAVAWLGTEPAAVGGDAHVYRHGYDPRFISYFFATHAFQRQKLMLLTGAKVRRVNASALESIKAPFPSLETQQAVAEKLDAMQELSDNLRLEREQRQKQFDYYREKLLSFPQKETAEV